MFYPEPDTEERVTMLEEAVSNIEYAIEALKHKSSIYADYIGDLEIVLNDLRRDYEREEAEFERQRAREEAELRRDSLRW